MGKSLIIGIGSTGLILEEAQQYHYEFTSKNKLEIMSIYLLETDISNKSRDTAGGKTQINSIFVDFGHDTNVISIN